MKRIGVLLLAVAITIGMAEVVQAGPFGLSMGMKESDFQDKLIPLPKEHGFYRTESVPKPHNLFGMYILMFSDKDGLCGIRAYGQVKTNVYGDAVRSAYSEIFDQLTNKYGPAKGYDYLKTGSIWSEPKDWMMSLIKKERHLGAVWVGDQLPDDIDGLGLDTSAKEDNFGIIKLFYDFKCLRGIIEEGRKAKSDAL